MKCIKYYHQHGGHVSRVSDQIAFDLVNGGAAMYAPKQWYKAAPAKTAKGDE